MFVFTYQIWCRWPNCIHLFYRIDTVNCWRWLVMNVSMDFKLLDFMLMNITACFKLPGTKSSKPLMNGDWIYALTNHYWTVIHLCLGHSKTSIFDSIVWSITLSKVNIPGLKYLRRWFEWTSYHLPGATYLDLMHLQLWWVSLSFSKFGLRNPAT